MALDDFEERAAYQIVNGIYHTVVSRDIMKRHRIKRQDLFDRVVKYVIENTGRTFSANSIAKFLKSERRTVSVESIYNYLKWLAQAFIIYPCPRYDLQGKTLLKTQEKYYLADVSLKYALLGYNRNMLDGALENIVFLELKRRGYDVFIGKNDVKEIDFVAQRRDERIYVQVCVALPAGSDREVGNLMEIRDHYPKYVVTLDSMAAGNENGIRIVHLRDFIFSAPQGAKKAELAEPVLTRKRNDISQLCFPPPSAGENNWNFIFSAPVEAENRGWLNRYAQTRQVFWGSWETVFPR